MGREGPAAAAAPEPGAPGARSRHAGRRRHRSRPRTLGSAGTERAPRLWQLRHDDPPSHRSDCWRGYRGDTDRRRIAVAPADGESREATPAARSGDRDDARQAARDRAARPSAARRRHRLRRRQRAGEELRPAGRPVCGRGDELHRAGEEPRPHRASPADDGRGGRAARHHGRGARPREAARLRSRRSRRPQLGRVPDRRRIDRSRRQYPHPGTRRRESDARGFSGCAGDVRRPHPARARPVGRSRAGGEADSRRPEASRDAARRRSGSSRHRRSANPRGAGRSGRGRDGHPGRAGAAGQGIGSDRPDGRRSPRHGRARRGASRRPAHPGRRPARRRRHRLRDGPPHRAGVLGRVAGGG